MTRPDLIRIDSFSEDSDSLSSQVPSTLDTPLYAQPIYTHNSTGTDTLLSSTPEALFSSTTPQASFEIMDPPLHQSIHICKSIKLLDFTYSCYSSSFTFFLASIHCFSEPSSYKETILDPLWQQDMDEKLGIWFLYLLVRVLLVYKINTNSNGSIERYKAKLVAKGYSEQYDMDYEETFAPINRKYCKIENIMFPIV
jgi:hypothetical protein